jgi:hypothetical protein
MLAKWNLRPQDVANLLNPAFDGLLILRALSGYLHEAGVGMPFATTFLVLPFVLHEPTRKRLPSKVTTHLATWLQDERDALLGFADRTADLVPYTQEALSFLLHHNLIQFDINGRVILGGAKLNPGSSTLTAASEEVRDCHKSALAVGRWLALSGNVQTVYSLLGIRP